MNTRAKWLMAALAATGLAGAAMAQTSTDPSTAPSTTTGAPPQHHWHHRPGMLGGGMLRAFHQLNLTAQQQQSVKTILSNAHQQFAAQRQAGTSPDFTVLSNPGDPNYATAQQALQSRMAERLQQRSQIQQQLYDVLTKDQKAQLPAILASMKARMAQHGGSAA